MKKILLFCSLGVLVLSLAAGVQAAPTLKSTVDQRKVIKITSQQDVIKLFRTVMGNRYSDLNSNAKSGAQGVYDYIVGEKKIATTTVNAEAVYAKTVLEQLDWFKAKFLLNLDSVLNSRDKAGIQYGMSKRYSDICAVEWNTAIKNLTKTYSAAVANAEKDRKGVKAKAAAGTKPAVLATGEELCGFNYNRDLKNTDIIPARNGDYDNAVKRFAAIEQLNNAKSKCVNDTYTVFYAAKDTALSAFIAGETAADGSYETCIGNRISAWSWQN